MIIYTAKLKRFLISAFFTLLPIFAGLTSNFIFLENHFDARVQLLLIAIVSVPTLATISSYFLFHNKKMMISYSACLSAIFIEQATFIYFIVLKDETGFNPFWILVSLLYAYSLYPFILGVFKVNEIISKFISNFFKKLDISIVSKEDEAEFSKIKSASADSIEEIKKVEKEFGHLDKDIRDIGNRINQYSTKALIRLRDFEDNSFKLRKNIVKSQDELNKLTIETKKKSYDLQKLKGLSKDQIYLLIGDQKRYNLISNIVCIIIGFLLGIGGSIIATLIVNNYLS